MATSGTYSYNLNAQEVIETAFQLAGIAGAGASLSAADMVLGYRLANLMLKAWAEEYRIHLWTRKEGVLFLQPYQESYTIGDSNTYATTSDDLITTQLNGAAAAAATALTVDSTTGMAINDYIGVVLTDNTVHWTTISNVGSSTTLTLTSGLASAASDNNLVYTFTNRLDVPTKILEARYRTGLDTGASSTELDTAMEELSHNDYYIIPTKTTTGICVNYMYKQQPDTMPFFVWPRPSTGAGRLMFTYTRNLQDLSADSNNLDIPTSHLEAFIYQLAVRLCTPYGRSVKLKELTPMAQSMLSNIASTDSEQNYVSFKLTRPCK